MKKAILVEYKGKNKKLTSGNMYSWQELADAFGLSKSTVVTRLKGKGSCRDKDFELTDMRKHRELLKIKKIKFVGEKKGFETGKDYTLVELSKMTGLKVNALQKRIGRNDTFSTHHVRPTSRGQAVKKELGNQFESRIESISAQWLRRKL